MRAVLDANVLISATLSRHGSPASLLAAWQAGAFELIVSPRLLAELRRAFAYPRLRDRVPPPEAEAFVDWLAGSATVVADPVGPPALRSTDAGDDYLLALASSAGAVLVSGDHDLLALSGRAPIRAPAEFLALIGE